jgi:hypothetical protein
MDRDDPGCHAAGYHGPGLPLPALTLVLTFMAAPFVTGVGHLVVQRGLATSHTPSGLDAGLDLHGFLLSYLISASDTYARYSAGLTSRLERQGSLTRL